MDVPIANQSSSNQTGKISFEFWDWMEIFFSGLRSRSCALIKNDRTKLPEDAKAKDRKGYVQTLESLRSLKSVKVAKSLWQHFQPIYFAPRFWTMHARINIKKIISLRICFILKIPQLYVRQHEGYRVLQHTAFGISFSFVLVPGPPPLTTIGWGQGIVPE